MKRLATIGLRGRQFLAMSSAAFRREDRGGDRRARHRRLPPTGLFQDHARPPAWRRQGSATNHLRALGTPKLGREAARGRPHLEMRAIFEAHLEEPAAQAEASPRSGDIAKTSSAALPCYEADGPPLPPGDPRRAPRRRPTPSRSSIFDGLFRSIIAPFRPLPRLRRYFPHWGKDEEGLQLPVSLPPLGEVDRRFIAAETKGVVHHSRDRGPGFTLEDGSHERSGARSYLRVAASVALIATPAAAQTSDKGAGVDRGGEGGDGRGRLGWAGQLGARATGSAAVG